MPRNPFTLLYEKLPSSLSIFPLAGAVVMPGTDLPLNIFEPRYLSMVFDNLGGHRMIGMVQPDVSNPAAKEAVYRTGCAGRITSFSETEDGRVLLVLTGVCRFDIKKELSAVNGYRRVVPDWTRFRSDYKASEEPIQDREELLRLLRSYCDVKQLEVAWDELELLHGGDLVNLLTCRLPLEVADKQALLETITVAERAKLLNALLGLAITQGVNATGTHH